MAIGSGVGDQFWLARPHLPDGYGGHERGHVDVGARRGLLSDAKPRDRRGVDARRRPHGRGRRRVDGRCDDEHGTSSLAAVFMLLAVPAFVAALALFALSRRDASKFQHSFSEKSIAHME